MSDKYPNWVPNDLMDTRKDMAVLLVGTAKEHGLVVRHNVASTNGGFYITDALADVLYDETEDEDVSGNPDAEDEGTTTTTKAKATAKAPKTSGTKAAKTTSQEGE